MNTKKHNVTFLKGPGLVWIFPTKEVFWEAPTTFPRVIYISD